MDAERFKNSVAAHQRELLHYTMKMLRNREAAAEIVQEAFLRLWKSEPGKVPVESERAWLYRVCRNMAIDHIRRDGRMVATEDMDAKFTTETTSDDFELERVLAAMDQLSDSQKEVVRLKYQHDMSYKEIAEITGMSVSNVGVTLHNAIKAMKKRMETSTQAGEAG